MDYKFVDFSFFKSSESWISSNEKSKIKGKDLKTLEKISDLKKTTFLEEMKSLREVFLLKMIDFYFLKMVCIIVLVVMIFGMV